jgi:CRP-like cAMP-binding protein
MTSADHPDGIALRRNRILAALPDAALANLAGRAEVVTLDFRQHLMTPDQPIDAVYFPLTGVVSLLTDTDSGTAEVATVGREGMVGVSVFLGADRGVLRGFCQIPGQAVRLDADALQATLQDVDGPLQRLLQRYTHALLAQVAQNVTCNIHHALEQRAARWLLTTADRVDDPTFPLTQQFLSQMLGVRRASVSGVASKLQADGLLTYSRGVVQILDRDGLTGTACECYGIVAGVYEAMTG